MINAQELRIGNIYNRKHGKGWTPTAITEEIMGKIFTGSIEYALDDFEDIPLTSDWLGACGLEPGFLGYQIEVNEVKIYFRWITNEFFMQESPLENPFLRLDYFRMDIRHVHQLQNLVIAITGQELTVKKIA